MIGYLKGTVSHLFNEYCFIEVGGVGYRVFIPFSTREKLSLGGQISLYTYLNVKEDALMLFGFYTQNEYELFLHLISVSGIGPKVAVNVLSNIKPDEFYLSVRTRRLEALIKIPGIGKKTAERIILELKDKISIDESKENDYAGDVNLSSIDLKQEYMSSIKVIDDAAAALLALGYSQSEIMPAIKRISDRNKDNSNPYTAEQLIKLVLRDFGTNDFKR